MVDGPFAATCRPLPSGRSRQPGVRRHPRPPLPPCEGALPAGAPAVDEVALVIPPGEADTVVALLRGTFEHAGRDGVVPPGPRT
jgi:hypothetical protein